MAFEWIKQSHNMVDIIHGVIQYNGLEAIIIESPIFARLQRILQSSLVYLTYPSNKVHRFEHSLGVMHLSGEFFYHSITNSKDNDINILFDEIYEDLKRWFCGDSNHLHPDGEVLSDIKGNFDKYFKPGREGLSCIDSIFFRQNTPSNLTEDSLFLYYVTFEAVRLVGLLHDIGHLPYSHIMEFALKRLYRSISMTDAEMNDDVIRNKEEFMDVMKPYCENDETQIHEAIGLYLVDKIFESIKNEYKNKGYNSEKAFLFSTFYMVKRILSSKPEENTIFRDLHRIVDGVIDCDRMDYCCRDLYCSGVSKEFPRYERIFNTVEILHFKPPKYDKYNNCDDTRMTCSFAFTSKALGQIEMLLQRRWEDFTTLNYHHRVHKHELIMQYAIMKLGEDYILNPPERKEEKDGLLEVEISSIWKTIKSVAGTGAVDMRVSQLDDEWLNTLLRYEFFRTYGGSYESRLNHHNDIKWNLLDELITGKKHYCSLFKRSGGFHRFDREFRDAFQRRYPDPPQAKEGEYYFNTVLLIVQKNPKIDSDKIYEILGDRLRKWSQGDEGKGSKIIDCIIDENSITPGIRASDMESIYIISSKEDKPPQLLKGRSSISKYLDDQKALFPSFHIYYLPMFNTDHNEYVSIETDVLMKTIAEKMVNILIEIMNDSEQDEE